MNRLLLVVLIYFNAIIPLVAQTSINTRLDQAAVFFNRGEYDQAMALLENILATEGVRADQQEKAWYIYGKAALSSDNLNEAEMAWAFLMENESDYYETEVFYLFGRTLFLEGRYTESLGVFDQFIRQFPESHLLSHAHFWAGESSFYLGDLQKAFNHYSILMRDYPDSEKFEAAYYRSLLIDSLFRENHLLEILRWSYSQNLKLQKDFENKEREYMTALDYYRSIIDDYNPRNDVDQKNLELLNIKSEALLLKEYYLNQMFELLYE